MSAAVGLRVLRLASALLRPRQAWGFGMQVAVSAAGMALGVGMLASGLARELSGHSVGLV